MEADILIEKNPWWKGKEYFKEDEDYKRWESNVIKWVPDIIESVEMRPFSLNIILGPRQTGKTTTVKLLISKLLEENQDPRAIFYFRCDVIKDHRELLEVLETYLKYREDNKIKKSYFFLDEITMVDEWFRALKELIDSGKLKNDVLFLTGSTSMKIMKTMELFPGRRGRGKDFVLMPLSFREFIKVINPDLHKRLFSFKSFDDVEEIKQVCNKNIVYLDEIKRMFEVYARIGGFPLAIISWKKQGHVDEITKSTYLSWIKTDFHKAGKDENIAKEILKAILAKIPSRISWESVSKEISVKSPKTVNSYIHTFKEMFLAYILHFLDPNSGFVKFGKNKKIAFIDPLIYEILEEWCLFKIKEKQAVVVEGIVASHLARAMSKNGLNEVYYWSNATEVDCLVKTNKSIVGFEVKWQEKAEAKRLIVGKMKNVFVISKNTFDKENNIVPASLFLASLET